MSETRTLEDLSLRELAEELLVEIRHGETVNSAESKRISHGVASQLWRLIGKRLGVLGRTDE